MVSRSEIKRSSGSRLCAALLVGVGGLFAAPLAQATSNVLFAFQLQYPVSLSDDNASCALCHQTTTGARGLNPYGTAISRNIPLGFPAVFTAIEQLNSDNDPGGYTNLEEINANTQPGWTGTAPSGVVGALDPTGNSGPVANPDTASTPVNTPVTIDVLANDFDADGDALTVGSIRTTAATSGTVVSTGTAVVYTPDVDFFCTATFDYTAYDGLDESSFATVTVTVGDNAPPSLTPPADTTITVPEGTRFLSKNDPAVAAWLASATATDAEDGDLTDQVSNDAANAFPLGATTVTFTVADSCGETTTATATLTLVVEGDTNTAPVVTAPDPFTYQAFFCATSVPATDQAIAIWLSLATATDAEDGALPVFNDAPDAFPAAPAPGVSTVVTFFTTDSGGLTDTDASTLTIIDSNTAPVVTAPAPLTLVVDSAPVPATDPAIAAWLASASATDAEDGAIGVTNDAPLQFTAGTTTVTFTATDNCGATTTATSTVTIVAGVDLQVNVFVKESIDVRVDEILKAYFYRDDQDIQATLDTTCQYKENVVPVDSGRWDDFNGDGFIDSLGRFPTAAFGFDCGTHLKTISCTGTLRDGRTFYGVSNEFNVSGLGCGGGGGTGGGTGGGSGGSGNPNNQPGGGGGGGTGGGTGTGTGTGTGSGQ